MDNAPQYVIEMLHITKEFPGIKANDDITLQLRKGEIHALLGENGAGKSTLMSVLFGLYQPEAGIIKKDGKEVQINNPNDATALHIGMVHQHFKLIDVFTVLDNIILGAEDTKLGFLQKKEARRKVLELSERYGLKVDIDAKIEDITVGMQQRVEILKMLYRDNEVLIFDEPTAVLTPQETEKLFDILRQMKAKGCAVIIITHKLNEVLAISDRVTILRKGKSVDTVATAGVDANKLTELMVGHAVSLAIRRPEPHDVHTILKVVDLTVEKPDGSLGLDDVSFHIHSGEILGVAGVAGSGQKELCECIAGLLPAKKGAVLYKKENILGKSPEAIIDLGISMSFVPEDRLGMGLVASMGMTDNMLLKSYRAGKGPFVDRAPARALAKKLVEELSIVTPGIETPVRLMSGGNVQKVLLGREIESDPNLLITAYPVRGLDINSSYLIYDLLNKQKEKGVAVMFIGEDLDVLLELCDRILVLCHGKVTGVVKAGEVTKEQIGLMMTGEMTEEEKQKEAAER